MTAEIRPWLEQLEAAIDLDWERRKLEAWKRVLEFQPVEDRFEANRSHGGREPGDWPPVRMSAALNDPGQMLLQQLGEVYKAACARTLRVPNIRCNYGTGILSSLFGAELFLMDDELNTLPTTRPMTGEGTIARVIAKGVPDPEAGLGGRVFETAAYFREALAPYPKTREAVWIYHPDFQGPIDVAELLWGSELYLAFYEQPERVKALTGLITETYIRMMRRWQALIPPRDPVCSAHWGLLIRGQIMLRDDSIVNLSPEMYAEFVKPYDERLLAEFGGGVMHFCGRGSQHIELMTDSQHLTGVNPSQPHLNDMAAVWRATVGRGKTLACPFHAEALRGLDLRRGVVLT